MITYIKHTELSFGNWLHYTYTVNCLLQHCIISHAKHQFYSSCSINEFSVLLLTFCPPGPELRLHLMSSSSENVKQNTHNSSKYKLFK